MQPGIHPYLGGRPQPHLGGGGGPPIGPGPILRGPPGLGIAIPPFLVFLFCGRHRFYYGRYEGFLCFSTFPMFSGIPASSKASQLSRPNTSSTGRARITPWASVERPQAFPIAAIISPFFSRGTTIMTKSRSS